MAENANVFEDATSRQLPASEALPAEAPSVWEALQFRIARRADELARQASPLLRRGSGRLLWIKAETEILGASSWAPFWNLLSLAARLSHGRNSGYGIQSNPTGQPTRGEVGLGLT